MKIKWFVLCLGLVGFLWVTRSFSDQPKTQKKVKQRQRQTTQVQRREQNESYLYKCKIDSINRGISSPYLIQYTIYRPRGESGPESRHASIPLKCDSERAGGGNGWSMSIKFDTLDEAMSFYNFLQNKALYGVGVPRGEMMEDFSSYYIGSQ